MSHYEALCVNAQALACRNPLSAMRTVRCRKAVKWAAAMLAAALAGLVRSKKQKLPAFAEFHYS